MLSSLSPTSVQPTATATVDPIKDVGLDTFMVDVIEVSKKHLVVVDFWAPWCGPCKQLGPMIEKVVRSYNGAVLLAKIDIDQNPEIAQQMGVQSIPAVFAFYQGRPVDGFMGALPETQIKSWIERVMKTANIPLPAIAENYDAALKYAADFLAAGDVAAAHEIYTDIITEDPLQPIAYAGLVRCLTTMGKLENARTMLQNVPEKMSKDKAIDSARAALELAEQAGQGGSVSDLEAKISQNSADYQARFDLALAYYAAGQKQEAVDALLEIVRLNRGWNDDAARKQLVKFFEAFGIMDPVTVAARKRLSSLLFA